MPLGRPEGNYLNRNEKNRFLGPNWNGFFLT
jgi:hypothetical protein